MSFRAVLTDLDGTILDNNNTMSTYSIETLQLLRNKGIPVIFATGRPYPYVFQTIDSLGLGNEYVITTNGSRVFDPQRRLIAEHNLDPDIVKELINIQKENNNSQPPLFSTNMFRYDQWLANYGMQEVLRAYEKSDFRCNVVNLHECSYDGVHAVFFVGNYETLLPVEEILKSRFYGKVEHTFSASCYLDVVKYGVNKGNAMSHIAEYLGISVKDIIAFGDGMNDFKMLQMAGKGCIMSNAHSRLKEALPNLEVIGLNTEDGVAKKLREVFDL